MPGVRPKDRTSPPPPRRRLRAQKTTSRRHSIDHLIGAREQARWHGETERLRGLEVDDELETRRLQDRELGRFYTTENLADVNSAMAVLLSNAGAVTHQAAGCG